MNRRGFLSRAGLLLGGGILAGPEVLDAFGKLTWRRKFFPGATFGGAAPSIHRTLYETIVQHKLMTGAAPTHLVMSPKLMMDAVQSCAYDPPRCDGEAMPLRFMGVALEADAYAAFDMVYARHIGVGTPLRSNLPSPGPLYRMFVTERRHSPVSLRG